MVLYDSFYAINSGSGHGNCNIDTDRGKETKYKWLSNYSHRLDCFPGVNYRMESYFMYQTTSTCVGGIDSSCSSSSINYVK